jgi:hypothetical protein
MNSGTLTPFLFLAEVSAWTGDVAELALTGGDRTRT